MSLTSLQRSHPDVLTNYDTANKLCTLDGAYSKVQSALAHLLASIPGGPQSAEHSSQPAAGGSSADRTVRKPHSLASEDQSRKPDERRKQRSKAQTPSDDLSSHRDVKHETREWFRTGQPEGGDVQLSARSPTLEEDISLIVDADIYEYVQKCCREENQQILSLYGVEVVDVTSEGLTTLFLRAAAAVGGPGTVQERVKLASEAICELYQEKESKICQTQVLKSILSPRGGLQKAIESLTARLPKILLKEDDIHVYIIGSCKEVNEAKHCLLQHDGSMGKKEDAASLLRHPSVASGSSTPGDEDRDPYTAGSLDDRIDPMVRSEEDVERARKYKLAARFKDSGMSALSSRPADFALRGLSSAGRQAGSGATSDPVGIAGVPKAAAPNIGEHILFQSGDTSVQSKLLDIKPKSTKAAHSATEPSQFGSPTEFQFDLKRASSFSGKTQGKAQGVAQKVEDDTGRPARSRGRSSSFSNQKGCDNREVSTAEIKVSLTMWHYIKDAYRTRVEDLSSDVQIKESDLQAGSDITVVIRGADPSKVSSCQRSLQILVDSVSANFALHELRLSELGVSDPADETLEACCADVRNRFKKVTIHMTKKSLFLLGPTALCSQVRTSLFEVFSGHRMQIPEQKDVSAPDGTPSTREEDRSANLLGSSLETLESQTRKDNGSRRQVGRTNHRGDPPETEPANGSVSQAPVRRDPVVKEKVGRSASVDCGQKTAVVPSSKERDESTTHANGQTDRNVSLQRKDRPAAQKESRQQRHTEVQDIPKESWTGQQDQGCMCVCGEMGASLKRTECGARMCSKCLDTVHIHCRDCHETELKTRGIQGKMSHANLNVSVAGHKNTAIKVTYCIADGIQGVRVSSQSNAS